MSMIIFINRFGGRNTGTSTYSPVVLQYSHVVNQTILYGKQMKREQSTTCFYDDTVA
jgi:hypothetical protein